MHSNFIFSSVTFEKWKQQARALKRSSGMPHHQALDQVAKENRFNDWHHVVTEGKRNQLSEAAYRSGLVVAYDVKDAMESWSADDAFVEDSRILHFCENNIFNWYQQNDEDVEDEDRPLTPSATSKYREHFEEWLQNICLFRYCASTLPASPADALPLFDERCFFAPMFFWLHGQFVDPWRDLAVDGVLNMKG